MASSASKMNSLTPPPTPPNLPPANAPSLRLVPATAAQARQCWDLNSTSWRGPLSPEGYIRRELHLGSQEMTRDGGATYWVLIDADEKSSDPRILSSCETYRKRAFVSRRRSDTENVGDVETVVSHGIGSVYCRDYFRGRGYAGRMMEELKRNMETWQQPAGTRATFNVLYSDIGKSFYAKRGWIPFPSAHISLTPQLRSGVLSLPKTNPLRKPDLEALCEIDEKVIKAGLADFNRSNSKVKVAFPPEISTIRWTHSREEFLADELGKPSVEIKGAIVDTPLGMRTWVIWTRKFDDDPAEKILHIIRLAVEREPTAQYAARDEAEAMSTERIRAIAACLRAAQDEAARWDLKHVQMWNPSSDTLTAARLLQPDINIVDREEDSIASLLWYGSEIAPSDLEWIGNEKYAWC